MDRVRYAVVGCGSIANNYHLPALVAIEGAEFVVACDLVEERARSAAQRFVAREFCSDYQAVVQRDDVDLVCIFTKIEAHAAVAMAAAQAGKHVFLQKPFARTLGEGERMVEVAKAHKVQLVTSFMHRFLDESLATAEWAQSGRIGRIEFIRQRNATGNPRHIAPSFGGALMDIGAHGIDLIRAVTGEEIRRVSARIDEEIEPVQAGVTRSVPREERPLLGGEANAWMLYELSSGATVSHEVQWAQRGGTSRFQMEIYGTEGSILVRVPRTGEDLAISILKEPGADNRQVDWIVPKLPGSRMGQAQHEELIEGIRRGDSRAPGEAGMAVLGVCEAARRSADTGCWVDTLG